MRELIAAGAVVFATGAGSFLAESPDAFQVGLHIVFFNVGQADAVAIVAPDGEAAVIDAGLGSSSAHKVAAFLRDAEENGAGEIADVKLGVVTHYDLDHVGGFPSFGDENISFRAVYDQGPSLKRHNAKRYKEYVEFVGDPNDNGEEDQGEEGYIRHRVTVGQSWKLGDATVTVVSVRGDTRGSQDDLDLDPRDKDIDENPGSIALLVTLGDFELYTAGDQTSDDWKAEPDAEIGVVHSGALGDDNDVDVLKANHHGSDTSNGREFVQALDPEVVVVSADYRSDYKLPKLVSLKQFIEAGATVYVTGDGLAPNGRFAQSSVAEDNGYTPPNGTVFNEAGDVHILVSRDGTRYRVFGAGAWREF